MIVGVYGQGCVGAVTAACLAEDGHDVVAVERDLGKINRLRHGIATVIEPGLGEKVRAAVASGRLTVTTDTEATVAKTSISLICVGTPAGVDGAIDLSQLDAACSAIGRGLAAKNDDHLVVIRSTVVPGTVRNRILPILDRHSRRAAGRDFGLGVNPEFLREGNAVEDFRHPAKTVIGELTPGACDLLLELYGPRRGVPVIRTDLESAELLKYADNAWHALKVDFANEMGAIARAYGVDGAALMRCFASDTTLNMSPAYLRPGAPFGGRCLAKDLSALRAEARLRHVDVPLLDAAVPSNEAQFARALRLIGAEACGGIGIIGATFKPGVDDTDTSVYARLGLALADRGHEVRFHDRHLAVAKSADTPVAHPRLCLVDSLGALLEFAQTLVLCHADEAYLALLRKAALPSQRLVDLTGAGALACGAATYVSIAG